MRKLSFITVSFIATSLLMAGCGSDETENVTTQSVSSPATATETPTNLTPNITTAVVTNINSNTVSLAGVMGNNKVTAQKVEGITKPENAIVDADFSNATGEFVYKTSLTNVVGNLTFGIKVEEPNSITDISLYLPEVEQTISLCSSDCGTSYNKTITGFNPQLSGIKASNLRLELFVTDSAQNTAMIDALTIDWRPIQISAVNATRENEKLSIQWEGASSLNRYNVYVATEPNLTPANVLSLENGQQLLAISTTAVEIDDKDTEKNYYILITGIDEAGESGLSIPIKIASSLIVPNQPPFAVTDEILVDEDSTITTNIIENDVDPENKTLTLTSIITPPFNGQLISQSDGEISYTPNTNFNGNDSFTYEIVDDAGNTAQASVSIIITNVNDAPVATNDVFNLEIDNTISVPQNGLTSNDFDIDGEFLFVNVVPVTLPLHGTLQLNADGSLNYTADASFASSDTFEYQVTDNKGGTSNAQVTLLRAGENVIPNAVNDTYETDEDTTLNIASANNGILANDSDPNSLTLTLNTALITTTSHGQLNLAENGTFTYIPNSNYHGIDSFSYEIENTLGEKAQAFVSLTIKPVDDIPTANNDNYQTNEDTALTVSSINGLLANDVDIDSGSLAINLSPIVLPQQGVVSLNAEGSFTYTPNNNFNGVDTFTYQVTNNQGATNTAQANITITAVDDAPQAVNDSASTHSDTPLTINVIANDTDIENDALTIIATSTAPINGTAEIISNQIIYTPDLAYFGVAIINYTIEDPAGEQSSATAQITVSLAASSNIDPIGTDDTYTIDEGNVLNGSSVLTNDSDPEGNTLTALTTPSTSVSNGTLILTADGTFTYTPQANFNGTDSFTYTLSDSQGGFSTAQVSLTVNAINDVPVAATDAYSTLENTSFTVIASDFNALLMNDSDNDGDSLFVNVGASTDPSSGTLSIASDGEFTYTPNNNFSGTDSFNYQLEDGNGGSVSGLVNITVINVNAPPETQTDNYSMIEGNVLNALSVLDNDTDPDGDTLTVDTSFTSLPSNGTVVFSDDGTFIYTPTSSFFGADNFSYKVDDGNGEQAEGLVHITISPDSHLHGNPLARNDNYTIDEDTTLVESTMLDNDKSDQTNMTDVTPLTVTTTPVSPPSNGNVTLQSNGTFTYTPNTNYNGNDFFEYEITNIYGNTSTAQIHIMVKAINDAPIANDDSFTVVKNSGKFKDKFLLDNDSDPEGSHLDIDETPFVNVQHGTLKLKKHGEVEYTPDTDYVGTDSFIYRLEDDDGDTDLATVTITITDN